MKTNRYPYAMDSVEYKVVMYAIFNDVTTDIPGLVNKLGLTPTKCRAKGFLRDVCGVCVVTPSGRGAVIKYENKTK